MNTAATPPVETTRCGFVAIVGRPNVGKSTLLNHLIGQKISITSRKAQTTRHRITGVLTDGPLQCVFVDTPGFQTRHRNALNRAMNRSVTQTLAEVDVILLVVEAGRYDERDRQVVELLPSGVPAILVINKLDKLADKARLLPFTEKLAAEHDWAAVVPVSAERGTQLPALLAEIRDRLPENPFMFAEDEITDRSERFLAAEIVREKVFRLVGEEIPYAITVEIEKFETVGALRRIFAAVIVDKANQKAIIIGKGGEKLKAIASDARRDMEKLFDGKVYLEIWVKVKGGWADDERALKSLGYD